MILLFYFGALLLVWLLLVKYGDIGEGQGFCFLRYTMYRVGKS